MMDQFQVRSEAEDWYEKNLSEEDYLFFANLNYNIYNKKFDSGDTIKNLRENYETRIKNLEEKYQKEKNELKNDFENKIEQKETKLQSLNEKLESALKQNDINTTLIIEFRNEKTTFQDNLKELLQRKEKPTDLGKIGEEYVYELLKNDSCIRVERISDQSHKGDFSVKFLNSSTCIMIDVKNYREGNKIPPKEHKKFIEDLDKNSEYDCGILLSLNGGFANNPVEFQIQESPDGKSYCYLGNLATRILPAIVLKCTLFSLLFATEKSIDSNASQSELIETIQESIRSLTTIQTNATDLSKQAEKTSTMALENMDFITKEKRKIELKFKQIKMKRSNDEVDANGDYHGENPSPSKFQRNN